MISAAHPEIRDNVAILFTMTDAPRSANCDRNDVQLNFRTLIP